MIELLKRNRILSVVELSGSAWRHPWHHRCAWNTELERWEADIKAGFVNGLDATVKMPVKEAMETKAKERIQSKTGDIDVWLSEDPKLALNTWRSLGRGAAPSNVGMSADGTVKITYEAVPEFFIELGVGAAANTVLDGDTMVTQISGVMGEEEEGTRLLRACEVVLYQDREAAILEMNPESPVTGQTSDYYVRYAKMPGSRERAYLQTLPKWAPMELGLALMVPRAELHVATVYMVSPPDEPIESDPDERWAPYVQHHCFWNLSHRANTPEPETPTQVITLQTGLAGGIGDVINQYLLTNSNDSTNQLLKQLQELMIDSRFWTV